VCYHSIAAPGQACSGSKARSPTPAGPFSFHLFDSGHNFVPSNQMSS
jgi:hypothetical protein